MSTTELPASLKAGAIHCWGFSHLPTKEVVGINVTHLLSHLFPDYWDMKKWHLRSYSKDRDEVKAWCEANDAIYYARDREEFSLEEAREMAIEAGKSRVVYEDLS